MRRVLLLILVASALSFPPVLPAAVAAFPGTNGRIAFYSERDPTTPYTGVFAMNPDGSDVVQLTHSGGSAVDIEWSSDGSKIAFWDGSIQVMNSDGSARHTLVDSGVYPTWSPDGSELAFSTNDDIYLVNAAGGTPSVLIQHPAVDIYPAWSPLGDEIAFVSNRGGQWDLWVAQLADTAHPTRLTSTTAIERRPEWSPDGSKIAFGNDPTNVNPSANQDVYVISSSGGSRTRLTTNAARDVGPAWSPDGSKIAFWSERDAGDPEVYLMNTDGSTEVRLTNSSGTDAGPDWQPCAEACSSVHELVPPTSVIELPINGDTYSRNSLTTFSGHASDPDTGASGVALVQLALAQRKVDGSCRWWNGSAFGEGKCRQPQWLNASGTESWTYSLSSSLRKSVGSTVVRDYFLRSRARDNEGNLETRIVVGQTKNVFGVE